MDSSSLSDGHRLSSRQAASFHGVLLRWVLGLMLAIGLAGCGTLPTPPQRSETRALTPSPDSPLVKLAAASTPSPALSGFRLLPLGAYSLDARLQLVQRATRSLDVQYYVLDDDATGRLLLARLADAAARGVRVRLLVDDLYTTNTDPLLRGFAALPNVEVRLFNPFCCARGSGLVGRFAASLADIRRLNHRMHNKLLVADNTMAVAGGRNIADDYFQRGTLHNFVDLDALMVGPIAGDLSSIFDRYWNSEVVWPIEAVPAAPMTPEARRAYFERSVAAERAAPAPPLPPVDALGYGPPTEDFEAGQLGLIWGTAMALADPPDKLSRDADKAYADSLAYQALMKIWSAERDVTITSPYLIPGPMGVAAFKALGQRNVKVTVLTNSLAATDEPLVHTGYSRYRTQMLDAGVDLYELSPSRAQRNKRLGMFGSSMGRLHAKTAIVDGQKSFIGSMNLDPRSRTQNTELGVMVESPQLAKEMLRIVKISKLQSAYRVRKAPGGGHLQWLTFDDEREVILDGEPESSIWLHLHNLIFGLFVPEQLL